MRFELLDGSGAVKGYATGRPEGDAAPSIAWRSASTSPPARAPARRSARSPTPPTRTRVALDLDAYARSPPALRWSPRCGPVARLRSAENLAAKLRVARAGGVDRVDFYHYGLAPLSALDRIREALALRADRHGV